MVEVDGWAVEDLRRRIRAARTAHIPLAGRWTYGTGTQVVGELLERWAQFDVEALVDGLNAVPQLDVAVDGLRIRAFHIRGERDDALPIVLTHGWPSTVLEPLALADRLARPSAHGADSEDCFHVVVPAMPGFPLSGAPAVLDDYTAARIADRWSSMMAALGYERFVSLEQHDGRARLRTLRGERGRHRCPRHHVARRSASDRVLGIHVSSNALDTPPLGTDLSPAERFWLRARASWDREEGAYMHLQQTKPLSLAHGLADSPAGLAAWISEKWHGWSDHRAATGDRFHPDDLLGHLTLYWLTNSMGTSLLHYYAYARPPGARPPAGSIDVPVSFVLSPAENGGIPPRELAERQFRVARWSELPRGGHFLASEEPELLAEDVREAFRPLRRRHA